jgi:hypothetical protein
LLKVTAGAEPRPAERAGFPFQKAEKWIVVQRIFSIPIFPDPARFFRAASALFLESLFFHPGF